MKRWRGRLSMAKMKRRIKQYVMPVIVFIVAAVIVVSAGCFIIDAFTGAMKIILTIMLTTIVIAYT